LSGNEVEPALPALSRHEPPTEALVLSGPEYVFGASQDSSPEVASLPLKAIASARLYQPFVSAGRAAVAVATGGVASYLNPKVADAL
jgi:hypothetical protein